MDKPLQKIIGFAISTLGSRALGYFRDILIFASFGANALGSAFIIAFTLPNLFRRISGEGALTTALLPVLNQEKLKGERKIWGLLDTLLKPLTIFLGGFSLFIILILLVIYSCLDIEVERYHHALILSAILFPYLFLVSLAAILNTTLQTFNRFSFTGLSPIWLNLSMIVSIGGIGYYMSKDPWTWVLCLCFGVLFGGFIQVLLPVLALNKIGWHQHPNPRNPSALTDVKTLFIPSLWGAGILQINSMFSRLLAFMIDDAAVAVLFIANRLVEFPLGVFGVAISTIFFQKMAEKKVNGDTTGLVKDFIEGVLLILKISLPAMVGLAMLAEPLIHLTFTWGAFQKADAIATSRILQVLCLSIPSYAISSFLTRYFHANQDTKTPVLIAWWSFLINISISLILIPFFGVMGLAIANVVSAGYQALSLLQKILKTPAFLDFSVWKRVPLLRISLIVLIMALMVWLWNEAIFHLVEDLTKITLFVQVFGGVVLGSLIYFTLSHIMGISIVKNQDSRLA